MAAGVSEDEFRRAVELVAKGPAPGKGKPAAASNDQKLAFYALFKQATDGPCAASAPSRLQMVARAKWTAWNDLGKLSKADARARYVAEVAKLYPNWRTLRPAAPAASKL